MKTWVRKTLSVGVLAAGALLFAPAAAQADDHVIQSNGDNVGFVNGTQIVAPIKVPVNVVGNSLAILGAADARGAGVNTITESGTDRRGRGDDHVIQSNGDNVGLLNGSQIYLPINVPVNVVGNAVAAAGAAKASGFGANHITESSRTESFDPDVIQSNGDNVGFINGTQLYAPIDIPINACGNSLALLGATSARAVCVNDLRSYHLHRRESAKVTESTRQSNGDNVGFLNGTQLFAPINLPVNLSGNSVAVLGATSARAASVNKIEESGGDDVVQSNGDNVGFLNGSQLYAPINVPINACGNSIGLLLGAAQSAAACVNDLSSVDADWDRDRCDHDRGCFGDRDRDCDWDFDHDRHGFGPDRCKGHNDNKGDHGNKGDHHGNKNDADDDDKYAAAGGAVSPATNAGYGGEEPDNYAKPAATGSDTKVKGGRQTGLPVNEVTETVGGVRDNAGLGGLLNTLR